MTGECEGAGGAGGLAVAPEIKGENPRRSISSLVRKFNKKAEKEGGKTLVIKPRSEISFISLLSII